MRHIAYGALENLTTAILIKSSCFNSQRIQDNYIKPGSLAIEQFIAFTLAYQPNGKCTAAYAKEYLADLLPEIDVLGIRTVLVADTLYFKYLTGNQKAALFYGYSCPCIIKDYEHINVILAPNYQAILYNPALQDKMTVALDTLRDVQAGTYQDPGLDIINAASYPDTLKGIAAALDDLHQYPELTCDIETRGLEFYNCGISTISFAWDKHNGTAFAVDRGDDPRETAKLLKAFLTAYQGKLTYHNASFDLKVLVYRLWMHDLGDYAGMLDGIEIVTRNFDDTKLIAYLATNNAVENVLKLKVLSQPFAGDYAQEDITDTAKIPLPQLLEYNLVDCLSTWYVKETYHPIMIQDDQDAVYQEIFKPSVKVILQTELCGMPIDPVKVAEAKTILTEIVEGHYAYFQQSPIIADFHYGQLLAKAEAATKKAKKKIYTIEDSVIACDFNPGSGKQLQGLIYDYLGYEALDFTNKKQPATGAKTIKKLLNNTQDLEHKELFENFIGISKAGKILSTFIPAFEKARQLPDGSWRLYGNFNLGGTQSGRLSSSKPNLQNLPSGSDYADIIKACFVSPPGWIFAGADFNALEDMVNALVTKDPNKLKVYTDGFCGHCLRSFFYFGSEMPDIIETVESVNSIKTKYPKIRKKSKSPTFLLTYYGTWAGLMGLGFSKEESLAIEANYHTMYKVADEWAAAKLDRAAEDGYVTLAFGLRLRTPILAQTIGKTSITPHMAQEEQRSAGNALTQSYGMLNSRASIEFQKRCLRSPYRLDIMPSAQIHDAIYPLMRDDVHVVKWVNDNLIECMQWQELPEIQHDTVKLGAELDLYWPDWAHAITLPNNISIEQIREHANQQPE